MKTLTLKFPILSAIIPASGGINIATTGVTADITAVSSTFMPSSLMWIVKYGYNTKIAEMKLGTSVFSKPNYSLYFYVLEECIKNKSFSGSNSFCLKSFAILLKNKWMYFFIFAVVTSLFVLLSNTFSHVIFLKSF